VHDAHRYIPTHEAGIDLGRVRAVCREDRALDITCADAQGHETAWRIRPLRIFVLDHAVMVLAWRCLRKHFRMFRVGRVCRIDVSSESFRHRRGPLLRDCLARLTAQRGAKARAKALIGRRGRGPPAQLKKSAREFSTIGKRSPLASPILP